ncbi:MAG TPA: hypothetical protein PKA28_06040 [Methylomusa anaerophila]|uniref:LTXXQ motif protein n=1 Tax=Methylomusa anaerophila TaxID=1930071 RepID=A0A348ALP6_9FIRM|nr:hypothetical protein [Methylomusa anaerophila]BBB91994.1 hypothetical protein MAMMFC1_02679 [Methylomusa anaerophila]HML87993.1 hypothetical protein [Methylomusa anaerophila]
MKNDLTKKIISGLAIGCVAVALGGAALAYDTKAAPAPGSNYSAQQHPGKSPADMKQHMADKLNKLVNDGVITKEQSTAIENFFAQKLEQGKAAREKMKNMTPEERKAFMEQKKQNHPDLTGELAKATGISEEQAKAVADALRPKFDPQAMEQHLTNQLNQLVAAGTITKDQSDKVQAFLRQKFEQHKADFEQHKADREKIKNLSPEERKAFMEQKKQNHPDLTNELAKAADLSAEQAKAVAEAIRPPHHHHPKGDVKPDTSKQ